MATIHMHSSINGARVNCFITDDDGNYCDITLKLNILPSNKTDENALPRLKTTSKPTLATKPTKPKSSSLSTKRPKLARTPKTTPKPKQATKPTTKKKSTTTSKSTPARKPKSLATKPTSSPKSSLKTPLSTAIPTSSPKSTSKTTLSTAILISSPKSTSKTPLSTAIPTSSPKSTSKTPLSTAKPTSSLKSTLTTLSSTALLKSSTVNPSSVEVVSAFTEATVVRNMEASTGHQSSSHKDDSNNNDLLWLLLPIILAAAAFAVAGYFVYRCRSRKTSNEPLVENVYEAVNCQTTTFINTMRIHEDGSRSPPPVPARNPSRDVPPDHHYDVAYNITTQISDASTEKLYDVAYGITTQISESAPERTYDVVYEARIRRHGTAEVPVRTYAAALQ